MATYFISQGHDAIPQWHEAFAEAQLIRPDEHQAKPVSGDCVWIMVDIDNWPARVSAFHQRGVLVLVMSYSPNASEAFQALESGARGYVHALSPPALLRQAQLVILNQGVWVPPELMARVVGGVFQRLGGKERLRSEALSLLTERERDVVLAVVEGYTNKEVARQLNITERTVKAHLGATFRKLDVRDRMQLVLRLSPSRELIADDEPSS